MACHVVSDYDAACVHECPGRGPQWRGQASFGSSRSRTTRSISTPRLT